MKSGTLCGAHCASWKHPGFISPQQPESPFPRGKRGTEETPTSKAKSAKPAWKPPAAHRPGGVPHSQTLTRSTYFTDRELRPGSTLALPLSFPVQPEAPCPQGTPSGHPAPDVTFQTYYPAREVSKFPPVSVSTNRSSSVSNHTAKP